MALNKPVLKNGIVALLTEMETKNVDAKEEFATQLSNLIDAFVKSGTVTVSAGIAVTTAGTATAQTGATTATGTGTIS
ncbi:hypothetical protein [Brumimicrobium mesophilum]|uniref:hypothetical protein n=1 Tax=Brumimicrobium mesophilum TaxID=392717 RepID=UPI000D143DE2|nr:hypothetical protein [Brumimicrobium mesophilum]